MDNHKTQHQLPLWILLSALCVISIASAVVVLCLGAVRIPVRDTFAILVYKITHNEAALAGLPVSSRQIVWQLRVPRIILGFTAGCGLSLCGTIMQAVVQNPMADPYILGISAGATLGATTSLFLGIGSVSGLWAFLGAAAACVLVMLLASSGGKATSVKLILAGMVVNALLSAFSNFIISVAGDADGMMTIKFWTMGSLVRADWTNIWPVVLVVLAVTVFFLTQARPLNTLLLGEEAALTLGINPVRCRFVYLLLISLLTGLLVSICGTIGFVGLVIPHLSRALVGTDHRRLIPVAVLLGGILMLWMDAAARSLIPQTELPVGIFTAVIGAPFFVYIMVRRSYGFGGSGEG